MKKEKLIRKLQKALIQKRELKSTLYWKDSTINSLQQHVQTLSERCAKLNEEMIKNERATGQPS